MAVIIGSARIDERGKARGGKAGDQTGREVSTQTWYNRITNPWVVLRPKIPAHAEKIARAMEMACANQHIGYDQGERDTLYSAAAAYGYDVSKVMKAVETDCSALVRVCCAYAGIRVGNFRTTNEASMLVATGMFDKLTDSRYIHRSDYLMRGDILVTKRQGHTVVVLTDGPKAGKVYAYGHRTLKKGMSGPDVAEMQRYLLALKYAMPKYGADGDFGAETLKAVKAFQADAGLTVDGTMDADDCAALTGIAENGWPEAEPIAPANPMEPSEPTADGAVYPVRGFIPDISSHQGEIDLDALAAGCDTAIFRVVRGNGLIDSQAVRNMSGCAKRNFPFSVYHFIKPYSVADAEALAVKMYGACAQYGPQIYWVDTETLWPGVTYAKNRVYLSAYVAKLTALGAAKVGIYTGSNRYANQYRRIQSVFTVPFPWLAHYGLNTGFLSNIPDNPCCLHQYTSYGGAKRNGIKVPGAPGVSRRVDLNRLTGNVPLSYFTGRKHSGTEYPGIVQATVDVNVRSGPGTNYEAVDRIPKGRYAIKRDGSVMGWQAVSYNGKNGYVSEKCLKAVDES